MRLALVPVPSPLLAAGPLEDPLPVLLVILVAALIRPPVQPSKDTITTIHQAVPPLASIDLAIRPRISASAINFAFIVKKNLTICKFPFKMRFVNPIEVPYSIFCIVPELSDIFAAIGKALSTEPRVDAILPMPIIGDSIEILEKPMTMGQIINPLAIIERAVWDEEHPSPIKGVSAERPDIANSIGLQNCPQPFRWPFLNPLR